MTGATPSDCVARARVRTAVRVALAVIAAFSCSLTATQTASNVVQTADAVTRLDAGRTIEREISGEQQHLYQLALTAGEYASVTVEQRGIDLVARLIDADGAVKIEVKSNGRDGKDILEFTVDRSATYQVRVEPRYPKASAAKYQIQIGERRLATERDRLLYEARTEMFQSSQWYRSGAYDKAQVAGERALEIRERVLGPDHTDVAASLNMFGLICNARGDYQRAESLFHRAIAINDQASDHAAAAAVLENLARNHARKGEYADAERLAKQALTITETNFAPDDFLVAESLGALVDVYVMKREFRSAQGFSDRGLDIAGKWYGPDSLRYADFIRGAGYMQLDLSNYPRAEQLFAQALDVAERHAGKDSPQAADSASALAYFYLAKGDNIKAEENYRRALAITEKIVRLDNLQLAAVLDGLGRISYRRGDYSSAEAFYGREMAIKEKQVGRDSPLMAAPLNNLGLVSWKKRDYSKAAELFGRTLELCEKAYGPESINVAQALLNLGIVAKETGDYSRAEGYYERTLSIEEKIFGTQHRELALPLESLGILYTDRGDYARAEPMLLRAQGITEQSVGPEHPDAARHLSNFAHLYWASGEMGRARESLQRMSAIEEKDLSLNLAIGSERQKLTYFDTLAGTLDRIISFQVRQPGDNNSEALALAATTLLQRKGRVFDAMVDSLGALRSHSNAEDLGLVDQLGHVTTQLATLVLNGPQRTPIADHQRQVKTLADQRDQLEQQLNRRTAGYYEPTGAVTLDAITAAVPADAALIEFGVYRPYDPKAAVEDTNKYDDPRYIAYVIRRGGEIRWKELGPASDIDEAVNAFRQALADPTRGNVQKVARVLDEKTMQPLRSLTGDATRLLLSPDGQLDLVPFEALVDEQGRYLVERYSIGYLTSGRDLLRLLVPRMSKSEPVIVADPLFGEPQGVPTAGTARPTLTRKSATTARRSITTAEDRSSVYFAPLAGTGQEARTIKSLFPDARVLTGRRATKAALKQLDAPSILHIATHGFFLQDAGRAATPAPNAAGTRAVGVQVSIQNPLLRSGLALSGANVNNSTTDDGVLTALEASNLNLWGTKLVTLSACDTGVGEVRNGEGVYGLRRAFFLAGTETVVMSLWPVSDYVTREMMTAYYGGLRKGLGRGAALRQAQLAMLTRKNRQHPFYWASFIQAGEWANLDGRR